jgi:mono/diheme cytochrome c family protein
MNAIARALSIGAAAAALLAGPATAQEPGEDIYRANCAQCHRPNGQGNPPSFPSLAGNERLSDPALIVRRIRYGYKSMPAFPDLGPEEVAAVASYVRASWGNRFAGLSADEAGTLLASVEPPDELAGRSIWDGVYTEEQAAGARLIYQGACAACHGTRLNGAPDAADMSPAPPLAGTAFMRSWNGSTVGSLFEFTRNSMPIRNPGQFSDQQYIDIIAYMLSYHGAPAGTAPLPPDIAFLNEIRVEPEDADR